MEKVHYKNELESLDARTKLIPETEKSKSFPDKAQGQGTLDKVAGRSRLKNADFRRKALQTLWLCLCLFAVGLVIGQRGPSMLDLQIITNCSFQQASVFVTAAAAGCVVGSLLGGIVYDLLSKSTLLIASIMLMSITTLATPFCTPYWLMVTACFLANFFAGAIIIAGNAKVIELWEGDRDGQGALQALHFFFAVGAVLAPLITEPFLASSSHAMNGNATSSGGGKSLHSSELLDVSTPPTVNFSKVTEGLLLTRYAAQPQVSSFPTTLAEHDLTMETDTFRSNVSSPGLDEFALPETQIHYAFIISACLIILTVIPVLVEQFRNRKNRHLQKETEMGLLERNDREQKKQKASQLQSYRVKEHLASYLGMLLWVCTFYVVYSSIEGTFPAYLTAYVVLQLNWDKPDGALVTSIFWIAFAASRFASIFLVKALSSLKLLAICFAMLLASLLGFLLASLWQLQWGVWLSSCSMGIAVSAVFPAGLSWIDSELMPVTGRVSAAVVFSANAGMMLNPVILGYLMESQGAIWLAYVFLGEATLCILIFVLLLRVTRLYFRGRFTVTSEQLIESLCVEGKVKPLAAAA